MRPPACGAPGRGGAPGRSAMKEPAGTASAGLRTEPPPSAVARMGARRGCGVTRGGAAGAWGRALEVEVGTAWTARRARRKTCPKTGARRREFARPGPDYFRFGCLAAQALTAFALLPDPRNRWGLETFFPHSCDPAAPSPASNFSELPCFGGGAFGTAGRVFSVRLMS